MVQPSSARYESDRIFARYLEAEWGDILRLGGQVPHLSNGLFQFGTRTLPFYGAVASILASYAPQNALCIDIGGGMGRLVFELSKRRPDLDLSFYDQSDRFTTFASKLFEGTAFNGELPIIGDDHGNLQNISLNHNTSTYMPDLCGTTISVLQSEPLVPATFDVVTCCNVFDRVDDPFGLVAKLSSAVKSGGLLLMTSPYDYALDAREAPHTIADVLPTGARILKKTDIQYDFRTSPRRVVQYHSQLILAHLGEAKASLV